MLRDEVILQKRKIYCRNSLSALMQITFSIFPTLSIVQPLPSSLGTGALVCWWVMARAGMADHSDGSIYYPNTPADGTGHMSHVSAPCTGQYYWIYIYLHFYRASKKKTV